MQIVILGGNGFVGSAIAKEAVARDMEVVSLSRLVPLGHSSVQPLGILSHPLLGYLLPSLL